MSEFALDASAVLAVIGKEKGWNRVAQLLPRSCISTVNLSEVVAKLTEKGVPIEGVKLQLSHYQMDIVGFDGGAAYLAGSLRPATRSLDLSFGDRACLALGLERRLPILTAERAWSKLKLGITVEVIR